LGARAGGSGLLPPLYGVLQIHELFIEAEALKPRNTL